MCNFIWLDIDSSLQTIDSKWLDSSCHATLTQLGQVMTGLEKIFDDSEFDSDSKGLWLWLGENDSGTSL